MELVLVYISLSTLGFSGPEYVILAVLSALLSGVAGAYITYLLVRRENFSKFRNYCCEAIEHVSLANSYWDRGEIQVSVNEMERAANSFLSARMYADKTHGKWCEILAENLTKQSNIIRKLIIMKQDHIFLPETVEKKHDSISSVPHSHLL